jgi:hypothetical protein
MNGESLPGGRLPTLQSHDTPTIQPRRKSVVEPRYRRPGTVARAIDRELKARKAPKQLSLPIAGDEP